MTRNITSPLDQDAELFESKVREVCPSVDYRDVRRYARAVFRVLGDWSHFHRTPPFLYALFLTPLVALFKKFDEVWNSNDHATWAALFVLVFRSGGEARENWSIHGVFGEAERL